MDKKSQHKELIDEAALQFEEIFNNSSQGMYIYLDDTHKICNEKFADILGYESLAEWSKNENSFTEIFVEENSAKELVGAYVDAMEKLIGSHINITWKKKNGENVKTDVILVPIPFEGHILALHFVSLL